MKGFVLLIVFVQKYYFDHYFIMNAVNYVGKGERGSR